MVKILETTGDRAYFGINAVGENDKGIMLKKVRDSIFVIFKIFLKSSVN